MHITSLHVKDLIICQLHVRISWLEKIVQLENINAEQKMLNFILGVFEDVVDHSSFGRDDDHNGCFQLLICLLCEKLAFKGRIYIAFS